MSNEYPVEVRRAARRLWLAGRLTYEQIAAQLKIPRADTIRDWRREEDWSALADDIGKAIEARVKVAIEKKEGALKEKYDQLAQVVESRAVRALSNPNLAAQDLRALASTLSLSLRIRKDLGQGSASDRLEATLEAMFLEEGNEDADRLGRCRTGSDGSATAIEVDPPERPTTTTTGSDAGPAA